VIQNQQRKPTNWFLLLLIGLIAFIRNSPEPIDRETNSSEHKVEISVLKIPAVLVKGGTFQMGAIDESCSDDTRPAHSVMLTDFYISATEVTIGQYKSYCRQTGKAMPEQEAGTDNSYPIAFITWYEADEFCKWVGGWLPSEAQWEYAARGGGMNIKYPHGNTLDHSLANYSGTGKTDKWKRVAPVAKFSANHLGLYDMAGNLYEWCQDYYRSDYYQSSGKINPIGPATGMFKTIRGGSWYHGEEAARTTSRYRYMPVARLSFVGFRVVWEPEKAPLAQ
jgi:formylglycine-generating enzyme required for sulfatase activity